MEKEEYATKQNQISSQAAIAVVSNDISYIKRDIGEIKNGIKDLASQFVNKSEFIEIMASVKDHEERIRLVEQNMWKWLGASSVLAAVLTTVISIAMKIIPFG